MSYLTCLGNQSRSQSPGLLYGWNGTRLSDTRYWLAQRSTKGDVNLGIKVGLCQTIGGEDKCLPVGRKAEGLLVFQYCWEFSPGHVICG